MPYLTKERSPDMEFRASGDSSRKGLRGLTQIVLTCAWSASTDTKLRTKKVLRKVREKVREKVLRKVRV